MALVRLQFSLTQQLQTHADPVFRSIVYTPEPGVGYSESVAEIRTPRSMEGLTPAFTPFSSASPQAYPTTPSTPGVVGIPQTPGTPGMGGGMMGMMGMSHRAPATPGDHSYDSMDMNPPPTPTSGLRDSSSSVGGPSMDRYLLPLSLSLSLSVFAS